MNIEVTKEKVEIKEESALPHEGEYNVNTCYFTFDEYTESFKFHTAIFTILSTKKSYTSDILENQCIIPPQVLQEEYDSVKLGVYSYNTEISDEEVILKNRTSPHYDIFVVQGGSYEEGAITPEMITPSQYEEYSALLQEGLDKIDEAVTEANNLDIDATKDNGITTVTITKKDGTPKEVEILDGVSLENMEIINRDLYVTYGGNTSDLGQIEPNIQVGTTTTVSPSSQARVTNTGTTLNPVFNFEIPKGEAGSIKFEIVEQLPATGSDDTIYLVPYEKVTVQELPTENIQLHTIYIVESTGKRYVYNGNEWIEISSDNQYIEYIYINNQWEELGSIGVDINLDDYYTKTETNNLLDTKQPLIDNDHKLPYSLISGTPDLTDYVKNTDYATSSVGGVIKTLSTYAIDMINGNLYANNKNYTDYGSLNNNAFISKGTLENVITGKDLTTKTYVDSLVGDVETLLTTLDIGSGV